ncbi:MAG: tetratricopeptide repeat protein, partial [Chitinophagales bacterium]
MSTISLNIPNAQEDQLLALAKRFHEELESPRHLAKANTLANLKKELYETLMVQDGFADLWQVHGSDITLYLSHPNTAIRNLPWRLVTVERPLLTIAKTTQQQIGKHEATDSYPLKVLVMVASPEGITRLSYEKEEEQLLRAFAPLMAKGLVEVHFTDDGSLDNLQEKLEENKYHILHFTGHGKYDEKKGEGFLALEDRNTGQLKEANATELNQLLTKIIHKNHRPDVVVLSACQTAKGVETSDLSGIADALLQGGTPAVVAMAASIMDKCATIFTTRLYEKIAKGNSLATAFQAGYTAIKQYEVQRFEATIKGQAPSQWLIPQLLMSQKVTHLINPLVEIQSIDFEKEAVIIQGKKVLLLKERPENYVFIGRRREKYQIRNALNTCKTILLKGQGGVGKTAFAEHLVMRLLVSNPKRKVFVLDEKQPKVKDLLNRMIHYLGEEKGVKNVRIDVEGFEKLEDKFNFLLKQLESHCVPVFIFDNVESFQIQEKTPKWNIAQYEDVLSILTILHQSKRFPVIVTGRYLIAELKNLKVCPMNTVAFGDFFRKCCQLNLRQLGAKLYADTDEIPINKKTTFENIVETLHQAFGGNYRALEFFDELYVQKGQDGLKKTLETLEDLAKINVAQGVLAKMSENLVFEQLLGFLNEQEKDSLYLLAHFAIPVLPMAIGQQRNKTKRTKELEQAVQLTLAEVQIGRDERIRYYVSPLVKELLKQHIPNTFAFDAKIAGDYHKYVFDEQLTENVETEFIQAFEQYYVAGAKKEVGEIGEELSRYYYGVQQYQLAFDYGKRTTDLLGAETRGLLHNRLGLLYQTAGDLDAALKHLEQSLASDHRLKDRFGEGTTLNNISQIYAAKGDYERALSYLEQSLSIRQEIGDRFGEGTTLNNISQIYKVRGDYERALSYLEQSLSI